MTLDRILLNLKRYGSSPSLAWTAYRALRNYRLISKSEFFDRDWMLRMNPGLVKSGSDPVFYLLVNRLPTVDPSPSFCSSEYAALHGLRAGECALLHYERIGKKRGFAISFREVEDNGGSKVGISQHQKVTEEDVLRSLESAEGKVRRKVVEGKRLNAVFLVYSFSIFPGRPLCDSLLRDRRFSVRVVVIPDVRWPEKTDLLKAVCLEEALAAYGSKIVVDASKKESDAEIMRKADLVCYATPYDLSLYPYNIRNSFGRPYLPIYFNYSYIVAKFSISVFSSRNFLYFWKVFFENASTMSEYASRALRGGKNAVLCGYVKMDAYAAVQVGPRDRKMVVIAPHHSFAGGYNDDLQISNFLEYADLFLRLPKQYPDLDFVFRPHPFFRSALSEEGVWGKKRADSYFDTLLANENVTLYSGPDYFEVFGRSDGIIQDCGSFLAEYFYTGKPQCYMLRNPAEIDRAFTEVGAQCLKHCYLAYSEADIVRFIEKVVIGGRDEMAASRVAFQQKIMTNHPHATLSALAIVERALGMSALHRSEGVCEREGQCARLG